MHLKFRELVQCFAKLCHHLLPIHSHHTESVGAEIRSKHLEELDSLAGDVTAVELRDGGGPDHLRQQGEEGGGDVSHTKVKEKEVHSRDLAVLGKDDHNDEDVANKNENGHAAENTDLQGLII